MSMQGIEPWSSNPEPVTSLTELSRLRYYGADEKYEKLKSRFPVSRLGIEPGTSEYEMGLLTIHHNVHRCLYTMHREVSDMD